MKKYKYLFTGDYHLKSDGTHEVKLIYVDTYGNETAFCEGEEVPEYCIEVKEEDFPNV